MNGSTAVTPWINANALYDGVSDTTNAEGVAALTGGSQHASNNTNLSRIITFGAGGPQSGTVYVRIGWSVGGGTNPTTNSTRRFNYIYKS